MDKPKRWCICGDPDCVDAQYPNADQMDEWLKAEVLPHLVARQGERGVANDFLDQVIIQIQGATDV